MKKTKKKQCDEKCYSTTHKCPIIVSVRKNYEDDSGCGKPCHVHINGINPFTFPKIDTQKPQRKYVINCEKCMEIIQERDYQLAEKDKEMLKLITDFITLPKSSDDVEAEKEAIKTHNFEALRELENKLMEKEKELAKLKVSECEELCYNVLREKQLELRWKGFELERQRPNRPLRDIPNMFVRIFNKLKALKRILEENPDHCFTKLQERERELLEKEKEIDEALEALRERKYNEEMAYLEEELRQRLKPTESDDAEIECSCECAKYNRLIEREQKRQEKMSHDACAYFPIGGYIPFWTCDTMELLKKTAYCPQKYE